MYLAFFFRCIILLNTLFIFFTLNYIASTSNALNFNECTLNKMHLSKRPNTIFNTIQLEKKNFFEIFPHIQKWIRFNSVFVSVMNNF